MTAATFVPREFVMSDADFRFIAGLIYRHAGITTGEGKRELVYARLAKRLRALKLDSFADYCDRLRDDAVELRECINALTTNVTRFFREPHHFAYLRNTLVPELVLGSARGGRRRLRIWSAGCSTGEEPYSIELTLRDCPQLQGWDVKILATDLDTSVLERARQGIYQEEQIRDIPVEALQHWFRRGANRNAGLIRVRPELQERIAFRCLNLKNPWPMRAVFDAIFCRNVVIYFDKETQRDLFARFAETLTDTGYLFLGHSENLLGLSDRFRAVGNTIYRKVH